MAATISTVPQYSRMIDEQGIELQQGHTGGAGESELTPLNPLTQLSAGQLHQKPGAGGAQQGSDTRGLSGQPMLAPTAATAALRVLQVGYRAACGPSQF